MDNVKYKIRQIKAGARPVAAILDLLPSRELNYVKRNYTEKLKSKYKGYDIYVRPNPTGINIVSSSFEFLGLLYN